MGTNANGMNTIENTRARRRPRKTTEAKRSSRDRGEQAKLQAALAEKKCKHCLTVGLWEITCTKERIRYLKCGACGKSDQEAV